MPLGGLAFYNCGPVSGASQPHKHVQVVPLPLDGTDGGDGSSAASSSGGAQAPIFAAVAAAAGSLPPDQPVELRNLPYAAFAATLEPPQQDSAAGPYLAGVYRQLLARCTAWTEQRVGQRGLTPQDGSLSYNWGARGGRLHQGLA